VLPGHEYAVVPAAHAAEILGLPGAGVSAAQVFRNKYRQRQICMKLGISSPEFRKVTSAEQAIAFMNSMGGPCVIKPTDRQASAGVQILESANDVLGAWRHSTLADEGTMAPPRPTASELLMERALQGAEYSVELLVHNGQPCFSNVTIKYVLEGRFPVEIGHALPANGQELNSVLINNTLQLCRATRFGTGVLHAEWIVEDSKPFFVECAARVPGDQIPRLIALAYDFDFLECYLRCLLDQTPIWSALPTCAAAIRFIVPPPGIVNEVHGVDHARACPGVREVSLYITPGEVMRTIRSSWDRAGHVMVTAESPTGAIETAQKAIERIRFRIS
jgi:biotin carboxylase